MKVIVQNLATEYSDSGHGPVMLMLHGWKESLHTFDQLLGQLATTWRVVRLDLPGFGGTEVPTGPWTLEDYATFVQAFCEKIDIRPGVVVGHSLGGRIILKAASQGLIKPNKIILIASAGITKSNSARNRTYKAVAKMGKAITMIPPLSFFRAKLRRKLYQSAGSDYLDAGALSETFLNIIAEDLQPNAQRIKIPTLLIWGDRDDQTPATDAHILNHLIHGSRLELISGAGHFARQEQPDAVGHLIVKFAAK